MILLVVGKSLIGIRFIFYFGVLLGCLASHKSTNGYGDSISWNSNSSDSGSSGGGGSLQNF